MLRSLTTEVREVIEMKRRQLVGILILCASVLAPSILGFAAEAEVTVSLPTWVVKAGGTVLGYFISDTGGDIIIGIKDGAKTAPIKIRRSSGVIYLEGNEPRVHYTGANCTGSVYLNDHDSNAVRAATDLLDAAYGVGADPLDSSVLKLYKGTGGAVGDPGISSTFINGSCGVGLFGDSFRAATAVFTFPFANPIPPGAITME
jgi:hypothetical protein